MNARTEQLREQIQKSIKSERRGLALESGTPQDGSAVARATPLGNRDHPRQGYDACIDGNLTPTQICAFGVQTSRLKHPRFWIVVIKSTPTCFDDASNLSPLSPPPNRYVACPP